MTSRLHFRICAINPDSRAMIIAEAAWRGQASAVAPGLDPGARRALPATLVFVLRLFCSAFLPLSAMLK